MFDHIPVFASLYSRSKVHKEYQNITIHKSVMHDTNLMVFQTDLCNVNWNWINHSPETSSKYKTFFKMFSELYEKNFPLERISDQSKGSPGTMDKHMIEEIVLAKTKNCILNF